MMHVFQMSVANLFSAGGKDFQELSCTNYKTEDYTASVTGSTNVTGAAVTISKYQQVGKLVKVHVRMTGTITANSTTSQLGVTLPFAATGLSSNCFVGNSTWSSPLGLSSEPTMYSSSADTLILNFTSGAADAGGALIATLFGEIWLA